MRMLEEVVWCRKEERVAWGHGTWLGRWGQTKAQSYFRYSTITNICTQFDLLTKTATCPHFPGAPAVGGQESSCTVTHFIALLYTRVPVIFSVRTWRTWISVLDPHLLQVHIYTYIIYIYTTIYTYTFPMLLFIFPPVVVLVNE